MGAMALIEYSVGETMDNRGQSIGILRLFLSLGAAAIVYWIMDTVTEPIFTMTAEASNSAKADAATGWFEWVVANSPIFFAVVCFFGLVVLSVYQSGRV